MQYSNHRDKVPFTHNRNHLDHPPRHTAKRLMSLQQSFQQLPHLYPHHPGFSRRLRMTMDCWWSLLFEGLVWLSLQHVCYDIDTRFPLQELMMSQISILLHNMVVGLIGLVYKD